MAGRVKWPRVEHGYRDVPETAGLRLVQPAPAEANQPTDAELRAALVGGALAIMGRKRLRAHLSEGRIMARRSWLLPALAAALAGGWLLSHADAGERGVRYALLVGCSQYRKSEFKQLPYTDRDVLGFKDALRATGFDEDHIFVVYDGAGDRRYLPEKAKILEALDFVLDGLRPEDTVVVALSGHGVQFKGDPVSYFAPVDGRVEDRASLIALSGKGGLYEKLKSCKAKRKMLLVNACRNQPAVSLDFANSKVELVDEDRAGEVPEGIAALYSCSAGQKSYYDPELKRAIFFEHLIRAWKGEYAKGAPVTLDEVFRQVCDKTKLHAHRLDARQTPVVQREFTGDWVITAAAKPPPSKPPASKPPVPPAAEVPKATADTGIIAEMKFVPIPRGTFWMGWDSDKKQSKQVTIERDFELAAYCVTQGQWQEVTGSNPSYFSRQGQGQGQDRVKDISDKDLEHFPVERVSWEDAQDFIKKVNAQETGKGWVYRLPKEAEWEYACRNAAKSKEECSFDFYFATGTNDLSSTQANFDGRVPAGNGAKGPYLARTTKVGSYAPNKLGLYDMHGNVWQWCEDLYDDKGPARVFRGGSWGDVGRDCRAASRDRYAPSARDFLLGFRLARVRVGG